jgi:hypothetical protein
MRRALDETTIIRRICEDAGLRRQFLWLRAQEKEDLEGARDLEAVDPTLIRCVTALQAGSGLCWGCSARQVAGIGGPFSAWRVVSWG